MVVNEKQITKALEAIGFYPVSHLHRMGTLKKVVYFNKQGQSINWYPGERD